MGIVHTRQVGGATSKQEKAPILTVEEKKEQLRKRIAKLKQQREAKVASQV